MTSEQVPRWLRDLVDRELERGERITWMGMPRAVYFTPMAMGSFVFGVPWTAFAIFWTVAAAWGAKNVQGAPGAFDIFPLFGLPFVLAGFGMLSAPLWAHWKAKRTVYVITDRRAITFEGGHSTVIRSYPPEKLTDVYRREKPDRSGDVLIARRAWRDSEGDRQTEELGLLRVSNAREVEQLLKQLAATARTPMNAEIDDGTDEWR